MAGPEAIADVGTTLVSLLTEGISDNATVALASPVDFDPDKVGLSLFLYDIAEDPTRRNDRKPVIGDTKEGDPLVLELSYLLTAHPSPDDMSHEKPVQAMDYHKELGKAMRIFQDNSIVSGSALAGSFGDDDRLHITFDGDATEEIMDVWGSFQDTPYLPSVSYLVTPVIIDSDEESPVTRVKQAQMKYHEEIE